MSTLTACRVIVREATPTDRPALLALYARFAQEAGNDKPDLRQHFAGICWVAEVDDELVGYCLGRVVQMQGETVSHGIHLYVVPEHRNTEASRALYRTSRRFTKQVGHRIVMWSQLVRLSMWRKLGYHAYHRSDHRVALVRDQ